MGKHEAPKHINTDSHNGKEYSARGSIAEEEKEIKQKANKKKKRKRRKKKILRILLLILLILILLCAGAAAAYFMWEKAPNVSVQTTPQPTETPKITPEAAVTASAEATPEPTEQLDNGIPPETERQNGVYTLLLVGNDDGTGNTDTMLVCRFDTVNHEINIANIPRDTIVNVDWPVRKLNSVYWAAESGNGEGIDALRMHIRWLTGFDVDCYAVVDLDVFVDVIDALGGIWFDVPVEIEPEDWMGYMWDYFDVLEPGYQHLNGYQCMAVVRHRSSYITGDLGRIQVQQSFMKAAASQLISLGNIPNIGKIMDILSDRLTTDLSAANIAFFIRQALLCSTDDINFFVLPTEPETLQDYSYAVPKDLEDWLEIINTKLSPFDTTIYEGNLNMIYEDWQGKYHGTAGIQGEWYFEEPEPETPEDDM